uniref:Uncharacterized protein n=1 Tax=Vespula pensylvanica TaxID=30213 RepID=A0A834NRX2_VESPE|nr:hypothetical protein H0235_011180 [Vespula pensylvanica]
MRQCLHDSHVWMFSVAGSLRLYEMRCLKIIFNSDIDYIRMFFGNNFIRSSLMDGKNDLIPAGSICNISIHNLHRTPEFCSNLDVFNPGKSLRTENIKERNLYSYIPFSAEPKNYIEIRIASTQNHSSLHIAQFLFEPVDELDDVKIIGDFILGSPKPLRVKFISIK